MNDLQIQRIMRPWRLGVSLFVMLSICLPLHAQSKTANQKLAAEVTQLVEQLDHPKKAKRDSAEAELLKQGPKILDLLPHPASDHSPQQRTSLKKIRRKLELQFAEQASQASLITLQSDSLRLSEVLQSLMKQSGNKIVDQRSDRKTKDPLLKVNFQKTPFFKALDQVLDQAKLSVDPYAADENEETSSAIYVVARRNKKYSRSERAYYSGIFRIEPINISSVRNFQNQAANQTVLTLQISWEPRISPILISHSLSNIVVVDDQGNKIGVEKLDTTQQIPINADVHTIELPIRLKLSPRAVKEIAQLQSKLNIFMPSPVVEMKIEKLQATKKLKIRRGDVHFIFREARRKKDQWTISTEVTYEENSKNLESHLSWVYRSVAHLVDPQGNIVKPVAVDNWQTERGVGSTYKFNIPGDLKGYQFIYKTPTALLEVPLKFKLKNLPLP